MAPFDIDPRALLLNAAAFAGRHALPLFGALLVVLVGLAAVGWWGLQRHLAHRADAGALPRRALGLRLALGFATIMGCGWFFAEVAERLGAGRTLGRADQALTDALRDSVPAAALHAFAAVTHLADTATQIGLGVVVAVALLALGRRALALGWVAAVGGNGVLNTALKQLFERARPVHDGGLVLADGFSFPSGHSSGAVVAYGMLAYLAMRLVPGRWHAPAALAALALAFTIGASRVFLRVHFASDVLAGFASGLAWLAVCVVSLELTRWVRRVPSHSVNRP